MVVTLEVFVGTYHLRGGDKRDNFASVYKARGVSGPYAADPNEVLRLEWLYPDKLPLALMPDAKAAVPDFRVGKLAF